MNEKNNSSESAEKEEEAEEEEEEEEDDDDDDDDDDDVTRAQVEGLGPHMFFFSGSVCLVGELGSSLVDSELQ